MNLQDYLKSRNANLHATFMDEESSSNSVDSPAAKFNNSKHTPNYFNIKEAVQEAKVDFNIYDDRWPCPFCTHKSLSKVKVRCHISRNHPNADLALFFEAPITEHTDTDSNIGDHNASSNVAYAASVPSVRDEGHTVFRNDNLVSKGIDMTSSEVTTNENFKSNSTDKESSAQNVPHFITCIRCIGAKKTFKGLRGMRTHYAHFHKEFLSDFDDPAKFDSYDTDNQHPSLPHDINDIVCERCTDKIKTCKGLHGLKVHYAFAHKEHLADLKSQSSNSSQNVNQLNPACDLEKFVKDLTKFRQTIRVLKRMPKGARVPAAKKLTELIDSCSINDDVQSWMQLLSFSYIALQVPKRSSKKNKLAVIVRNIYCVEKLEKSVMYSFLLSPDCAILC